MYGSMRITVPQKTIKSLRAPRTAVKGLTVKLPTPTIRKHFLPAINPQLDAELEKRAAPLTECNGTLLERVVYKALQDLHVQFNFQSSLQGGRLSWQFGRQVADFALYQYMKIIEVQGGYWHSKLDRMMTDAHRELVLRSLGWIVLYLEEDVVKDKARLETWLLNNIVCGNLSGSGYIISRWQANNS